MDMQRKGIAWLLVLLMTLGLSLPAMATESATDALPAVDDVIEGFVVREVGTFDVLGAPAILLEHEKTGALVYHIAASDVNRSFDITFRTPTVDNRGTPHVFEHITISGSESYPSPNLFFPMINQTYNTYINAMTMWNCTTYPLSSLSEDQLLKLMDVYLDGVFHPLLYTDQRLYRREAWRYELADADDDLTITGTVYNEMRGARTISWLADLNIASLLYPGSLQGNDPGGDPAVIPELTYEELLAFHDAYYHPSNALVVLYGDLDLARALNLLDEGYFSHYDRKEIVVPNGDIAPQTEYVEAAFPYAVEAGSPTEGGSIITYGFVANGAELADEISLNVLTSVLSHQASPLQVAVRERMPGASVGVGVDMSYPQMNIIFSATGVDPDDAPTLKAVVDETMAQIAADGLDADLVQAVIANNRFEMLTMPEMSNLGTQLSPSIAMIWARGGSVHYFNDFLAQLEHLRGLGDDVSLYSDLIDRYILQNAHAAMATTYPEPGLAEQEAAALAQRLADYKASLSEAEVQALVDATAEMAAFSTEEAPLELLKSLQAVTVQTLPEETDEYAISDETRDGVRYITAAAQAGDIGLTQIVLDTSWVPAEDLHTLMLYVSLLGSLDTAQHTKEELSLLNTRYLNGLMVNAGMMELAEDTYRPVLSAQWLGLMDDYETGVSLVHETLFETKFDNIADIQNVVAMSKIQMRQMLVSYPYINQIQRANAVFTDHAAYDNHLGGMAYYQALSDFEAQLAENPEQVTAALTELQTTLQNKTDAMVIFTGNEDALQAFEGGIDTFFDGMDAQTLGAADYSSLPRPALNEAIVVDSQVQYNLVYAPMEVLDIPYSGIIDPMTQILYDAYLTPSLRHGLGAYDTLTQMNRHGMLISSYRDPTIAETFGVLAGMGDFLADLQITQEDLDRYIISAYSGYALPLGALNGAANAINLHLSGRPADEKLTRMREMKAMTVEDLHALAPALEKLYTDGAHSTAGGAAMIEANKDLYDEILRVE